MSYTNHIRVENLNLHYGDAHILKNVDIAIPDKKIVAIIGPSGCGKTTLLRSFNRLIDDTEGVKVSGKILVDGENIFDPKLDITEVRKKMGLLSQRPSPLPMSIYDNIAYGPRIHGEKDRKKLDVIVEKYLRIGSLWDDVKGRLHDPASRLSIGQQQRLCLARGLAVEPEIILADEPTSALDPISSQRIEESFIQLKNDYTIIMVTHVLRQARRLADYVVFMYLGEVIEHAPVDEFFEDPKHELTQEYIRGIIS